VYGDDDIPTSPATKECGRVALDAMDYI